MVYSRSDMTNLATKTIILTTRSWLGGKNTGLASAYLLTGLLSLGFSFYFTHCYVAYPRKVGDIGDLKWGEKGMAHKARNPSRQTPRSITQTGM